MQHRRHQSQSHLSPRRLTTPGGAGAIIVSEPKRGKKRGSYTCGRCGLPKKGHSCYVSITTDTNSPISSTPTHAPDSSVAVSATRPPPTRHFRRALSFDDDVGDVNGGFPEEEDDLDLGDPVADPESSGFPAGCLWEILRRLPPAGLLAAASVCKGWRETAKRLWRAAEELRLRVPARAQVGLVGSVLQKCPGIVRLSLRMERLGFSDTGHYQI